MWLITYQIYEDQQQKGVPRTVISTMSPEQFIQDSSKRNGRQYSTVILFAIKRSSED